MIRSLLLMATLVAPLPAMANCVSADDLAGGVRFEMGPGVYWELRGQGRDRQARFQWSPEYPVQTMDLARGVFIVSLATPDMDAPWRAEFNPDVRSSPHPTPGVEWRSRMTGTGFGTTRVDDMRFVWGAARNATFGDCTYVAVPLALHSEPTDPSHNGTIAGYLYFPEFGGIVIESDGYGNSWPITGVSAQ